MQVSVKFNEGMYAYVLTDAKGNRYVSKNYASYHKALSEGKKHDFEMRRR